MKTVAQVCLPLAGVRRHSKLFAFCIKIFSKPTHHASPTHLENSIPPPSSWPHRFIPTIFPQRFAAPKRERGCRPSAEQPTSSSSLCHRSHKPNTAQLDDAPANWLNVEGVFLS